MEIVHQQEALACWQVGSKEEAIAAVQAGYDYIIVQGIEAGGHLRGHIGLLALLDEIPDAVDVPVMVAGGIGSARAMAALAAGADGVRVGTGFVAAEAFEREIVGRGESSSGERFSICRCQVGVPAWSSQPGLQQERH